MLYELPTKVDVNGIQYSIRSDYRAILDICCALNDCNLQEREKPIIALLIFYKDFDELPSESYQEAFEKCLWFVDGGKERTRKTGKKAPKLMDWEQDFPFIVGPVNRVLGKEIRSLKYLHWWSFLSAYTEIGDCTFQKIVSIRSKRAKGMKLEKGEREWYLQNREIVDFKMEYSHAENEMLSQWTGET